MSKTRNKALVDDTRWKTKGGPHKRLDPQPTICYACDGEGKIHTAYGLLTCGMCKGMGELWTKRN